MSEILEVGGPNYRGTLTHYRANDHIGCGISLEINCFHVVIPEADALSARERALQWVPNDYYLQ